MNKTQIQIICIEMVIIGLVLWRYFDKSLTLNYAISYTFFYLLCMIGWFYFQGK